VHFTAEFYKQGEVECWMRFSDGSRSPTHLCLFGMAGPVRKIDSPAGSFAYNTRTNRVFATQRDERTKKWFLDFAGFFKRSLEAARTSDSTRIRTEREPETGAETIIIDVDEGTRKCRYSIDPATKLPISFATVETKDLASYLRQTIAVKAMQRIEYDLPVPEDMFEIPADAEVVTNEHDVHVHPDIGLDVTGLPRDAACRTIIDEVLASMNALDFARIKRLSWPFMVPPPEKVEEIRAAAGDRPLVEKLEVGTPYERGEYWYVPCVTRELGTKVKRDEVPIKFYEFDGRTYCLIAWPD
jgi:hypothetical protein